MSKKIFWIASYPKSGNTLLRSIISSLFFSDNGVFDFNIIKKIDQFEVTERLNFIKNLNEEDYCNLNKIDIISKYWQIIQHHESKKIKKDFGFLKTHSALISINSNVFTSETLTKGYIYVIRDPRDVVISWSKHSGLELNESIDFITNDNSCNAWVSKKKLKKENKILCYISSWKQNVISWTKNNIMVPKLLIKFEDLVYNKENVILDIIYFFKKNYNIEIRNVDNKIKNILHSTNFQTMKKLEEKFGFKEAVNGPFFRDGSKNQWQNILNDNQIEKLENCFKETMKECGYKFKKELK